jgi:CRISPR-associated protein Csm4
MITRKFKCYKLTFPAGLHLNRGRNHYDKTEEYIHSDTFFAALQAVWAKWGEDPALLESTVISSLFPFFSDHKGQGTRYFFPKPFIPHIEDSKAPENHAKLLKKIKWLDQEYFEKLVTNTFKLNWSDLQGKFLSTISIGPISRRSSRIRTRVARKLNEDTKPYYIDELYFSENAGLYLLIDKNQDTVNLERALRMLGDEGIGTDKSSGKGYFTYSVDYINLQVPENGDFKTNLSLYCPESEEEWGSCTTGKHMYSLVKRGGWLTDNKFKNYRKNEIFMVEEGSLLHHSGKWLPHAGTIKDLAPSILKSRGLNHPVWRSGKSLFIPIQLD